MRRLVLLAALALSALAFPGTLKAQATRADSAGILLDAGRRLEAEGRRDAARAVFEYLVRHYADTEAAQVARGDLGLIRERTGARDGRVELIAWSTTYGLWLGIAVPVMLEVDEAEVFGVGLIAGGPLGFALSNAYARSARPTLGQARATTFAFRWGAWQAMGWREVLDIGEEEICDPQWGYCYEKENDRAPWTAMVAGGVGSMLVTAALVRGRDLPAGAVTFATQSAYWGTWFGAMLGVLLDQEDDDYFAAVLLGGNAGLVAGALVAPPNVSANRVRLTTAAGIAGIAAGFGLDLIVQPDDEHVAALIPTVASAAALAIGWNLTREMDDDAPSGGGAGAQTALLELGERGLGVGLPAVLPTRVTVGERGLRRITRPGLAVPLLRVTF